jgi:hypothetical protein
MNWDHVAQLAPIGTATIALVAALVALGAILAQKKTARTRAAIDVFLKTEMDAGVLEMHNGFKRSMKELATLMARPDLFDCEEYSQVCAYLNVCELIAVGVRRRALSERVSHDYWGEAIPFAFEVARPLIERLRQVPTEGNRNTYRDLELLSAKWRRIEAQGRIGHFRVWWMH